MREKESRSIYPLSIEARDAAEVLFFMVVGDEDDDGDDGEWW